MHVCCVGRHAAALALRSCTSCSVLVANLIIHQARSGRKKSDPGRLECAPGLDRGVASVAFVFQHTTASCHRRSVSVRHCGGPYTAPCEPRPFGLLAQVARAHLHLGLPHRGVGLQAPLSRTLSVLHVWPLSLGVVISALGRKPASSQAGTLPPIGARLYRPPSLPPGTSLTAAGAAEPLAETASDPRPGHRRSW